MISLIALFVALGGTSYAVVSLPRNSVGSAQLRSGAVTSAKVRDGSIRSADLAASARSARGPRGAVGPPGPPGGADAVAPEPWRPLPFAGSWGNYGSGYGIAGYRRDARGRVYLRGLVTKIAGTPTAAEVIAVLPPGYRPTERGVFAASSGVGTPGNAYGRVDVLTTGEVLWGAGGDGEIDFTSLETVSFWSD